MAKSLSPRSSRSSINPPRSRQGPLPVEEVDVWLADHARFLHPLRKARTRQSVFARLRSCASKKEENLVGVRITKQSKPL
jgi:hypothetical protein